MSCESGIIILFDIQLFSGPTLDGSDIQQISVAFVAEILVTMYYLYKAIQRSGLSRQCHGPPRYSSIELLLTQSNQLSNLWLHKQRQACQVVYIMFTLRHSVIILLTRSNFINFNSLSGNLPWLYWSCYKGTAQQISVRRLSDFRNHLDISWGVGLFCPFAGSSKSHLSMHQQLKVWLISRECLNLET